MYQRQVDVVEKQCRVTRSRGFCFLCKGGNLMNWATVVILVLAFFVGYSISAGRRMKKKNRNYKV